VRTCSSRVVTGGNCYDVQRRWAQALSVTSKRRPHPTRKRRHLTDPPTQLNIRPSPVGLCLLQCGRKHVLRGPSESPRNANRSLCLGPGLPSPSRNWLANRLGDLLDLTDEMIYCYVRE
jgi:hypothetical protein